MKRRYLTSESASFIKKMVLKEAACTCENIAHEKQKSMCKNVATSSKYTPGFGTFHYCDDCTASHPVPDNVPVPSSGTANESMASMDLINQTMPNAQDGQDCAGCGNNFVPILDHPGQGEMCPNCQGSKEDDSEQEEDPKEESVVESFVNRNTQFFSSQPQSLAITSARPTVHAEAADKKSRSLHHYDMDANQIPHNVNPGPQLTCNGCGDLRWGADFESNDVNAPCHTCRKRGAKNEGLISTRLVQCLGCGFEAPVIPTDAAGEIDFMASTFVNQMCGACVQNGVEAPPVAEATTLRRFSMAIINERRKA